MATTKLHILIATATLTLCVSGSIARAQEMVAAPAATASTSSEASDRAQIAAASGNAIESLRQDLEARTIDPASPDLTIGEFLNRTEGRERFTKTLHRAEQIGGPRWVNDQTCQVTMEIDGARVVQTLCDIAVSAGDRAPMPADVLDKKLENWKRRSFAATGSSIRADRAGNVKPSGAADAWRNVDDRARTTAINAARDAAVQRTLDTIRPVQIGADAAHSSIGDLLAVNEPLSKAMTTWLVSRPVTSLRFADNMQVYYGLAVDSDDLFDTFLAEAKHANVKLSEDVGTLNKARDEFRKRVTRGTTTGRGALRRGPNKGANAAPAVVGAAGQNALAPESLAIPDPAPDWIYHQIDANGNAPASPSRLHTKQQAEDAAAEAIRTKLLSMPFTPGMTVGEAAKKDPKIDRAVNRAIARARVFKVDYDPNGPVSVKMMIDPREFWTDLNR